MSLNISHIENLCRSFAGVAENKENDFIQEVHIESSVDKFIREKINKNKIVLLTGNPGDGKTHLILKLKKEFPKNVIFIQEGGQYINNLNKLKKIIDENYNKHPVIIAINTGILSALLKISEKSNWYDSVKKQMYENLSYDDNDMTNDNNIYVIDLNYRNNLSKIIVSEILKKIIEISKPCNGCKGNCLPLYNIERLKLEKIQNQICLLLHKVAETGYHCTFRDLSSYISYLIFGNTSCNKQKEGTARKVGHFYFENAFKKPKKMNDKGLFDEIIKFDPVKMTNLDIDDKIWYDEIQSNEWIMDLDKDNLLSNLDDKKKREWFKRKKRRIFFEHKKIIDNEITLFLTSNDPLIEILNDPKSSIKRILILINKSFGDNQKEVLSLWLTHRFDTYKDKFVIKSYNIPKEQFNIIKPSLNSTFKNAFHDWIPDHVLLYYNNKIKLKIDRTVLQSLNNLDSGQTSKYRNSETYLRINLFLEKLAEFKEKEDPSNNEFSIVNIEKNMIVSTTIDFKNNKYKRPY